mgnify:FL=1|tara:strand:+ start:835 stop:1464 length:630 start_codon:yes stop_codon:yes gene_type:complete
MEKRYRKLVKELIFVYSELEYVSEVLRDAHCEFELVYQKFCSDNAVPLPELNKEHEERINEVIPQPKKTEVDEEGLVKMDHQPKIPEKIHKIFTKMYRMVASKIHPDKFANREETPEIKEKIDVFKKATSSYNSRNWGRFLDICEKLDILPTRYDGINSTIRDEISDINKEIVQKKRAFSWKLHECEEEKACQDRVIKDFLFQLFKYKL